jgi:prolyl 4-hydroxylase
LHAGSRVITRRWRIRARPLRPAPGLSGRAPRALAAARAVRPPGFLPPALCADLVALIDRNRRPSEIADANGDHYFRTSETCDLSDEDRGAGPRGAAPRASTRSTSRHGEPVQGQRYAVGQEFKAHTDYFEPDGRDFHKFCSVAGQRTWTFMIYLNDVEAGGATRFKVIDKMFKPETGKLSAGTTTAPTAASTRRRSTTE